MLTAERLRELLHYDPETGIFTWIAKSSPKSKVKIGSTAGHANADGYLRIKVAGQGYLGHRLAWLYMTGEWPKDQVDHINMGRADNRFANLRVATNVQNSRNRRAHSNNTSGFKGSSIDKRCGQYRARIMIGGKDFWLGLFATPESAHAAYAAVASKVFGEFARTA